MTPPNGVGSLQKMVPFPPLESWGVRRPERLTALRGANAPTSPLLTQRTGGDGRKIRPLSLPAAQKERRPFPTS